MKLDSFLRIGTLMVLVAAALAATTTLVVMAAGPFDDLAVYMLPSAALATALGWTGFGALLWSTLHERDELKSFVEQQLAAIGHPTRIKRLVGGTLADIYRHKWQAGWINFSGVARESKTNTYWADLGAVAEALPTLAYPLLAFRGSNGELYGAVFGVTTSLPAEALGQSANRMRITMIGEAREVPRRLRR